MIKDVIKYMNFKQAKIFIKIIINTNIKYNGRYTSLYIHHINAISKC